MLYIRWPKPQLRGCMNRLRRDTSGSVMILAAACMLILLGVSSLAIDYGVSQVARSKLESAADAATLRGARTVVDGYNQASQYGTPDWGVLEASGLGTAKVSFKANAGKLYNVEIPDPTVTVTHGNGKVQVSTGWRTEASLTLGRALGWPSIKISGESVASASLPTYLQFVFLVDVSNSMGIGGTPAEITKLLNDPQIGCSFACHDPNHLRDPVDFRELARTKSIKLKIDYVHDAMQIFMSQIIAQNASAALPSTFSVGLYTFGSAYNEVIRPTTNLSAASSATNAVDLEVAHVQDPHYGYTYLDDALFSLSNDLSNVGDGSSVSRRQTYVVVLTDGVQDVTDLSGPEDRRTNTDYLRGCSAVKSKGVELVTIHAPIAPLAGVDYPRYLSLIAPIASDVPRDLKLCSSDASKDYFEAVNGPDISTAVTTMLNRATAPLALTR